MEEKDRGAQHVSDLDIHPQSNGVDGTVHSPTVQMKHNSKGILLVPQPSDTRKLEFGIAENWSSPKKGITLAIICLAAYSVLLSSLANTSGFFFQAALYHKTPVEITYTVQTAIAGLVVGPLIWTPIGTRFGKAAVIFWSMLLTICANVWSACMTKEDQYIAFTMSRLFAGLFVSAAITLGSNFIVEVFFLHDRGKCFAIYTFCILIGGASSSTYSGYIVQKVGWPVQFWYNVGFEGLIAILCLLFLDETVWTRDESQPVPRPPDGFLRRKLATYAFTTRLTPRKTKDEVIRSITLPLIIAVCPVTILIGTTLMVFYGWGIAINTFLSIFLQNKIEMGGYGFSPERNADFTFTFWIGGFAAELWGALLGDRLPLAICARKGGTWKPEYRLHTLWLPLLVCFPIATGIFGATLHYHWNYMVLALAVFLSNYGAVASFPPLLNYLIEAFTPKYANEIAAAANIYRSVLSIGVTFFLIPWTDKVGINVAFGMMSVFTVLAFGLVALCMVWGPQIRAKSFVHAKSEAGIHIMDKNTEMKEANA